MTRAEQHKLAMLVIATVSVLPFVAWLAHH